VTVEEFQNILTKRNILYTENGSYICQGLHYRYDANNKTVQVRGKIPYSFVSRLKQEKRIISLPSENYISNDQMLDYIKKSENCLWFEQVMTLKKMREYYISHLPDKIYYSLIMIEDVLGLMIWLSQWNKFTLEQQKSQEKKLVKELKVD